LLIFLTPHIVQNPTELAALSAKERGKSDALKNLPQRDLNHFLDNLPMKETTPPPRTSNGNHP
jgi:type II secretory pathway component GspD/PulD (secretin)